MALVCCVGVLRWVVACVAMFVVGQCSLLLCCCVVAFVCCWFIVVLFRFCVGVHTKILFSLSRNFFWTLYISRFRIYEMFELWDII